MVRRDALIASLISSGLMAGLLPFARIGVDFHHDGIMLKPALDVLSGQILFRDTFMQYGALSCYLQAAALGVHPSLLSLRLLTVAAYGVSLFFLYAAWRLILPRALTIISCGLFILFIPYSEKGWLGQYWTLLPWSSVYAMMFQSLGLYALFRVIRDEQPEHWGVVLGLATACVFWCRQPVGVVMTGCLVLVGGALHWTNWTPVRRSKQSILLRVIFGFVLVNALLVLGLFLSGALPDWWYQNFVWPRKWLLDQTARWYVFKYDFVRPAAGASLLALGLAAALPALMQRFRPAFSPRSRTVYFALLGGVMAWQYERMLEVFALGAGGWNALVPCAVLLQAVISGTQAVVDRNSSKTKDYYMVSALAVVGLGSLLQFFPVPDSLHIFWSLAPVFGLFVYVFWRYIGWSPPVVALVLTAIFLPALSGKVRSIQQALARPLVTLDRPALLRGMRVPQKQAYAVEQIANLSRQILRHRPDIPSALIGEDALYLCFTDNKTNVSPYYVTWPGLADQPANAKRWSNIQSHRPVMFLHKARWKEVENFYRGSRYVPLLYLPDHELVIAVPQELADAMGLGAYGAAKKE